MSDTSTQPEDQSAPDPDAAQDTQDTQDTADSGTPDEPMTEEGGTGTPTFPGQKLKHKGKEGAIEKIADDYVIPLSDDAMKEWAKGNPEVFKVYAVQVACGMYPTFAPQIQAGIPTRVLLDPYIQVAAQVLGPVMTEPNWSDPKWSAALQGGIDPKTGRSIPMTLNEWRTFVMQHPSHNFQQSPMAHEAAGNAIEAIHTAFGGKGAM